MNTEKIFIIACAVTIVIMLIYYIRRKRRLLSAFFGAVSGLAVLLLMNRFGGQFGAELPLNTFNICGSAVLGIPFVALMIIIKLL